MTARKPFALPVESWIDQQVRAAAAEGPARQAPGSGKAATEAGHQRSGLVDQAEGGRRGPRAAAAAEPSGSEGRPDQAGRHLADDRRAEGSRGAAPAQRADPEGQPAVDERAADEPGGDSGPRAGSRSGGRRTAARDVVLRPLGCAGGPCRRGLCLEDAVARSFVPRTGPRPCVPVRAVPGLCRRRRRAAAVVPLGGAVHWRLCRARRLAPASRPSCSGGRCPPPPPPALDPSLAGSARATSRCPAVLGLRPPGFGQPRVVRTSPNLGFLPGLPGPIRSCHQKRGEPWVTPVVPPRPTPSTLDRERPSDRRSGPLRSLCWRSAGLSSRDSQDDHASLA